MTDDLQKRVISTNLTRLLENNNKSQREVAIAIGVSPQTFNTWVQGIAIPRMGKIQALADYFHIKKSEIIDEQLLAAPSSRGSATLAPDEEKLLESYRVLNDLGKRKVREYAFDLTQIPSNIASGTVEDMG